MNESETRAELIDPALEAAGWGDAGSGRVGREVIITLGRLQGAGMRAKRDIADYVLFYKNQPLAVIEAKAESATVTGGLAQAKRYAEKLQTPFAFATNGRGIYRVDMRDGKEGDVAAYPSPEELWDAVYGESEARERHWRERFSAIPFHNKGGQWQPRPYQHNAINRALGAICSGQDRILLTLATGTGKTASAFQIAWKLYQSRWNLADWRTGVGDKGRRPRVLFLADRNNLADQAFNEFNKFNAFPEDALVRIEPDEIRAKGAVPKNGNVFFTIFQTFMTGADAAGDPKPYFGEYPPKFFDFIVIDECHRGGANYESKWRGIMEYFAPAVQLGLTATPRREENVDTYEYFGEPVYIYSLKEGINDGYLTPFRVKQIVTTMDEYKYDSDDEVFAGEIDTKRVYGKKDFNRNIKIDARERKRINIFMNDVDQREKTLVFCKGQKHAAHCRDFINQVATSANPYYCVRVTSADGEDGEEKLRTFRDNEKTIPTILTTSQKLSTGVDARNVRNIVLMRPVNSIIEFKQIVGRGTRLFDGKDYFTIYDFEGAYKHFSDPEWDGEPLPDDSEHRADISIADVPDEKGPPETCANCGRAPCVCNRSEMIEVKLSDGKARAIQHMMATTFWNPDGTLMTPKQFIEQLFDKLPALFKDEDELRKIWSLPETRRKLLEELKEKGYDSRRLGELQHLVAAENSDIYDVLAYVAFTSPPISREERVQANSPVILSGCDEKQQEFLRFVLAQYVKEGFGELDDRKLPELLELQYQTSHEAVDKLGMDADKIRGLFIDFQRILYQPPDPPAA